MPNIAEFTERLHALATRQDYWSEVWKAIEALPIYATGDNFSLEIRPFAELDTPPSTLSAIPIDFERRWESLAFTQTALEGMVGTESLEDFGATLRAARIEIIKARMFCIAQHVFWTTDETQDSMSWPAVTAWANSIEPQHPWYADDAYFRPFTEPLSVLPRGAASWLRDWLQFRYDVQRCPVRLVYPGRGSVSQDKQDDTEVDRSIVLSAAALAWHDYSLIDSIEAIEAKELSAAAGHALYLALQAAGDDDDPDERPEQWGRKGGLIRHQHTRALKEWALSEAARLPGADRQIARELAARLPTRFEKVSEDPARLIYDAIRDHRAAQRNRARPTAPPARSRDG